MINPGLFTSTHGKWGTPQALFDKLNEEFAFTLDACATAETAKCDNYYSEDALEKDWPGVVFCNCPYGLEISKWVEKGYTEATKGALVVMLLPARTDSRWWHEWVMKAYEIRLIRGRLRFTDELGAARNSAPFPSCIVVFSPCWWIGDRWTPVWSSYEL